VWPAVTSPCRSPLAGRLRGAHGARGCERPGRHLGRGRRLGLRRHLTPSGRREVTPVSAQPRHLSNTNTPPFHRKRSFRAGWIRQLTRPEAQQTCRNLRGTHRRQKRTSAHKVVVLSVSSSSLCVAAPAPALHPNPYVQALRPPPLTHFQTLRPVVDPAACHATSLGRRTAELAADRRPEPTDVPSSPPASLLSWSHFPTCALLCASITWLRAVPRCRILVPQPW
jgi:hypothetical protein